MRTCGGSSSSQRPRTRTARWPSTLARMFLVHGVVAEGRAIIGDPLCDFPKRLVLIDRILHSDSLFEQGAHHDCMVEIRTE